MNKVVIFIFLCMSLFVNAQGDTLKSESVKSTDGKEDIARYFNLIHKYYKKGEYELHKAYSDSLLLIAERYNNKEMSVLALNSQAIYYKNRSNNEKAIALYYNALEICNLISDNRGPKAMILANMGNLYTDIGSYDKSIETMDELLVITDTIKMFSKIKASALIGQSSNYLELKQYEKSLQYAKQALALGTLMSDDEVIAVSYNNISDVYIKSKNYNKALESTTKALALDELQIATSKRGSLLLNNGIAHFYLSNLDKAFDSLTEALEIGQEKKVLELEMHCYQYLAKIYEQQDDFEKSYVAQKEYSRLKNIILLDSKDATVVDLEKEISDSNNSLTEAKEVAELSEKRSKKLIIYGGIAVIIILGTLFFYISKKRDAELRNRDLQREYSLLKQRIEDKNPIIATVTKDSLIEKSTPYKNSSLTPEAREAYKQQILLLMKKDKPYLISDLSLSGLASKLGMSTSHFSEVLHYCFQENFYNFINFYRVREAQELLGQASYEEEKILTVAFDSGFKSKTTFNRVFKNFTGVTPSEYRNNL